MLDPEQITPTLHAWRRFVERWPGPRPECYRRELHRLLRIATPDDLGHATVYRILNNGYRPAAYFLADGWRFVLDEPLQRILTCERVVHTGRKPRKKIRSRHRR